MASGDILSTVTALVEPLVQALGCSLWGVEYQPQGNHSLLRIYIDKPEGITLEDCQRVSEQVSATLDVEEPISAHYSLEVSSPGIERPLFTRAQYGESIGKVVRVRLCSPVKERRKYQGVLVAVTDDLVVLQIDDANIELPFSAIDKGRICWID